MQRERCRTSSPQENNTPYITIYYNRKCNTVQDQTIQYNTIQYNTIQYNTIHENTVQYSAVVNTVEITVESVVIQYSSNTLQYSSVVLHKVFFTYMFVISASFPVNQQEQ